jgi:hypothetical protein
MVCMGIYSSWLNWGPPAGWGCCRAALLVDPTANGGDSG